MIDGNQQVSVHYLDIPKEIQSKLNFKGYLDELMKTYENSFFYEIEDD